MGVPIRFKTLEKLNCHQNRSPSEISEPDYSDEVVADIVEQLQQVLQLNLQTNRGYIRNLVRMNGKSIFPCGCSAKRLFVGVDGEVYLCRKCDPIGSLKKASMDDIWQSQKKREIVERMRTPHGTALSLGFSND
jgi:Iron-sulfur cluster-binding domain